MKNSKRLLVMVLSVMMIFATLPFPVFAGETEETGVLPEGAAIQVEESSESGQAEAPVIEEIPEAAEEAVPGIAPIDVSGTDTVVQEPAEGASDAGSDAAAPVKKNDKQTKAAEPKAADHVLTVEMPTAGTKIEWHSYPKVEDSVEDAGVWTYVWVADKSELAKELADALGDHSSTYSRATGNFLAGETYYSVLEVEFPEGETADVSRVKLSETDDIKMAGDAVLLESENSVVIPIAVTIPAITVTVEFGSGHEDVAAAAAAASEDVPMTVNGSTLTYKAQKGSDRWYDATSPIRDVLYQVPDEDNGERMYRGFIQYNLKPLSSYADAEAWGADAEEVMDSVPQNEDLTVYVQWTKPTGVALSIEAPVCGTEITYQEPTSPEYIGGSIPAPAITVTDGNAKVYDDYLYWVELDDSGSPAAPFEGTVEAGETYTAMFYLMPAFGYFVDQDKITVEGGTLKTFSSYGGDAPLLIEVEADHDWDMESVEISWDENNNATATVTCKNHPSHVLTETVKPDAKVTKEPTTTEWGETTYTANFKNKILRDAVGADNTLILEDIERITYEVVEGDGQTWTKGSGVSADFRVERSYKDEETYGLFTGIKVDGKTVPASEYTTEEGSVIIKIQPAYLETLANGEHTLTVAFEDANIDATFTVEGGTGGARTGDDTNTGLWSLLLAVSLAVMTGTAAASRRKREER